MIKATEEAEQISMLLHSSNYHESFKDGACSSTEYNPKSPNGRESNDKINTSKSAL
jgi:hypothetical protein